MAIPDPITITFEEGVSHHRAGRLDAAAASYQRVLGKDSSHWRALHALGVVKHQRGASDEAVSLIEKAVALRPDYPEALFNLGTIKHALGRIEEAIAHWREAIRLRPQDANALVSLSAVLCDRGEAEEAAALSARAVTLNPGLAEGHLNLANALATLGRSGEAIEHYRDFLARKPDSVVGHNNLGNALKAIGRFDEAIASYRQALRIDTDYLAAHSNILMCMLYRSECADEALLDEHRAWRRRLDKVPRWPVQRRFPAASRLRIGFVSPDFRLHSCAYFIEPLFAHHDRTRFEFFAYSDVLRADEVTARLRGHAAQWRDCASWNDEMLARRIAEDGIDILVDLAGHTNRNRLRLFAGKAAPIQASWLGYPATTGMDEIDFRLTDAIADPPGHADRQHVERLVRMDGCFLAYRPADEAPAIAMRSGDIVTFGSFNNPVKLSGATVALWAKVLHTVPGSRLLLKGKGLQEPLARDWVIASFAREGIGADRLTLAGWRGALRDHLASYAEVDVALDPTPYNGTTTTMEALWMGVPVVSLAGTRHSARVGTSLLISAGLPEFVAQTPAEYVAVAAGLARDGPRLASYRAGLRQHLARSPLLDGADFARRFEAALQSIAVPQ
jgi:predicted O-linked N-acetylglucosamine transferase (SPINDLY family)